MAKILVIEDNEMNAELQKFLLESEGHQLTLAIDGATGVELAKSATFDTILLDIQLPKADGYAVLKQLKEACPQIPVIAVSSYAMVGDAERALQAGFDGYISKPIEARKFATQVIEMSKLSGC